MSKVYYESKNLNKMPEDVMEEMLGGTCQCGKQKEDDLEREYQNAKNQFIQDVMKQNADLRERIAQYQEKISELEKEIRKRDPEYGTVDRLIQKVMDGDVAEVQISFRMKRYFDD